MTSVKSADFQLEITDFLWIPLKKQLQDLSEEPKGTRLGFTGNPLKSTDFSESAFISQTSTRKHGTTKNHLPRKGHPRM